MVGNSPPHHRHDGSSPLPLGMDASPAPARWTGPNTVWPHDPRTGWSYCVIIPSWVVLPEAKTADGKFINPTVFYRVQVGIQSPQGVSTVRGVLRRFSDFLKLFAALKRTFPKKRIPVAPPKNSMLRINSSQTYLQERRHALIDWIVKLLADIDISRSAPMASFLELEAAARSAMNVVNEAQPSTNASNPSPKSGVSWNGGSSSVTSGAEYGSDSTCDVPGVETPKRTSEQGLEMEIEDLVAEQQADGNTEVSQEFKDTDKEELHILTVENLSLEVEDALTLKDTSSTGDGDTLEASSVTTPKMQLMHGSVEKARAGHGRRPSVDSIASEMSSARGSELSFAATGDAAMEGFSWDRNGRDQSSDRLPSFDAEILKGVQAALPMDQRGNVRRVLATLQRRLSTAKADMEDLIARLNQETAVKEFLATKVRDLEGELDNTRRKTRETLQRAVSMERESYTNLQWELEEFRTALISADEQAQAQQEARIQAEERLHIVETEKERMEHELVELREKLQSLQKDRDNIEAKARADMRVLAREIKALRKSQPELKEELELALQTKAELETAVQRERQWQEKQRTFRAKFCHEVGTLRQRLQECSVDFLAKEDEKSIMKNVAITDAIDLLTTSDNRIGLLLAEAQLLAEEKEEDEAIRQSLRKGELQNGLHAGSSISRAQMRTDQDVGSEEALRKMLTEIFIDNAQLHKVVNSLTLNALLMDSKQEKGGPEEVPTRKSVLNRFL